jgi:hypothetical protein
MKVAKLLVVRNVRHVILPCLLAGAVFSCQSSEKVKENAGSGKKSSQKTTSTIPAASIDSAANAAVPEKQEQKKLVVYYLHTTFRCHSCNMIEQLTTAAVKSGFAEQIEKGRVELKSLNIEEKGNEHFVKDYKLYTKSVILSDMKDGKELKWKNLDKVWTLLGNESKFVEYIQTEIKLYL